MRTTKQHSVQRESFDITYTCLARFAYTSSNVRGDTNTHAHFENYNCDQQYREQNDGNKHHICIHFIVELSFLFGIFTRTKKNK